MSDLQGRRALVTGGGTGIGFGCAKRLLAAGAQVTIAGRRREVLEDAAHRLGETGQTPGVVVCDVTEEEQVRATVAAAADGGNLDILVANAGGAYPGAILQVGADVWDSSLRLNVIGTALCIKHAGLIMREHGGGSIIAISSTSATKVQPWLATYVTSKAALDMLVHCAAIELSPHHIRVNSIQPGYVPTQAVESATLDELTSTHIRATPLGRPGTPEDVGNAVAFLAGDEATWITGQVFGVDGGLNIPVMPSVASFAERIYGKETIIAYTIPDFVGLEKRGEPT